MAEITIDTTNKEQYSNGTYPEVTSIIWRLGDLNGNILKNFPNLTILYCNDNGITDLSPLQLCCSGLTELDCSYNDITDLSPLRYFKRLTILYCYHNRITDLSPLQHCKELTTLRCSNNQINNLEPLINLEKLCILYFTNNPLNFPSDRLIQFLERIDRNRM